MKAPWWTRALLGALAPPARREEILGDLEEVHRARVGRRGRVVASLLTSLESLDLGVAVLRERMRRAAPRQTGERPTGAGLQGSGRGQWISWLDLKLGLRTLVKHRGLTLVSALGLGIAMAIGATFFTLLAPMAHPRLPLNEGERIVGLTIWNPETAEGDSPTLQNFVSWRGELESLVELGAFRTVRRNLIGSDGLARPLVLAEMTASGFQVARVPPLLGRYFSPEDEQAGAAPVVVIGYDTWRRMFGADPGVVGTELRLGTQRYTLVGVMPEGFGFPVNHDFWVPLRTSPSDSGDVGNAGVQVFGRLAPGVSMEEAQAELAVVESRDLSTSPLTRVPREPRVTSYPEALGYSMEGGTTEVYLAQLLLALLLVVVGANVAILVYARTATRQGEIAVRRALGASRRRIVGQLFVEGLLLSSVAAVVGLLAAWIALEYWRGLVEGGSFALVIRGVTVGFPFWVSLSLAPGTVGYIVLLSLLAAVLVGIVPAVGATARRGRVSPGSLAGTTRMQLGKTWTVLVITQVAVVVAALPGALSLAGGQLQRGLARPAFPANEFLTTWIEDHGDVPLQERLAALKTRLEAEPHVEGITLASGLPGEEPRARIHADGVADPLDSPDGHRVGVLSVDERFFDVFQVPVLAGRAFDSGDAGPGAPPVIVNESFVREVLGGRNALGRHLRRADGDGSPEGKAADRTPWLGIVGVVGDLPPNREDPDALHPRIYLPLKLGSTGSASLALRVRGADPATLGPRLRAIATQLDPSLQLYGILPLDEVYQRGGKQFDRLMALTIGLLTLSVLLLSAAGIYALMSFAVTRRRREIGIRSALGAEPGRLLASIFSRAFGQLAMGATLGIGTAILLDRSMEGELMGGHAALLLPAVVALIIMVALLAATGPARRGLRIQPMEALRED